MSRPPRATIVVPCFNHAHYLGDALQSVLGQDYGDFEAIVVDDGSTDNTPEVVRKFADPRIKYIHQENQGLSAARNTGVKSASGEMIAFLDADDCYEPAFLSTMLQLLANDGGAHAAYCGYRFVDEGNQPLPRIESRVIPPEDFLSAMLDGDHLVPACFLVYRDCFDRAGCFDTKLRSCEDWDMWLRLAEDFRIIGSPAALVRYRAVSNSMSSDLATMADQRLAVLEKRRNGSTPTSRLNRAFAYAHLQNAVSFLHAAQHVEAYRSLHRMTEIYPEILNDEAVFYELGCAHQPRGCRGNFSSLDLAKATETVESALREIIRTLGRDYAKAACSRAHYALAKLAYGTGDSRRARRRAARAVVTDFSLLFTPAFAAGFAKSLLPGKLRSRG